jgi:hypothetical protein
MRHIRSVYDVQRIYHPLQMGGKWSIHQDVELVKLVSYLNAKALSEFLLVRSVGQVC